MRAYFRLTLASKAPRTPRTDCGNGLAVATKEDGMTRRSTTMTMMSLMVTVAVVIAVPAPARGGESHAAQQGSTTDGRSVFQTYCASCHGESGRGNGAVAVFLRRPPADLTQIAKRNKGVFPAERVYQQIDGRQVVKAHGDSQMPVWGDAFSKVTVGSDDASIKARIDALVKHLASIQER